MKKITMMLMSAALVIGSASPAFAKRGKNKLEKAKKECLAENPSLAGRELQKCVKEKASK